jgi:hypothetical protein
VADPFATTTAAGVSCPDGDVCAFSGKAEGGTEYKDPVPKDEKKGGCTELAPDGVTIDSVINNTKHKIAVEDGTCQKPGKLDPKDEVSPGKTEDLPDPKDAIEADLGGAGLEV